MFQDLNHIEYIKVVPLGKNKRVSKEKFQSILVVIFHEVVIGVGGVDLVVVRILKDRRVKCIERDKVLNLTLLVLNEPRVHNAFTWTKEMMDVTFR